uniref:Serum response factor binding protein 1 n=1 Tax=Sphenodon punctatus TaxID=8508 RepID=A0A8D0GPV0_SPHPU
GFTVVKMRKEVKKARVLTIRRLTRHIAKLKSKKGTEDAILKNKKRAQRLLEEIHAMKEVKPDSVTKFALGKEIDFETVCKKPNSTAADRAIARLATHPLLKTKVADIKAAIKAFKDARRTPTSEENKLEERVAEQPEFMPHFSNVVDNNTLKPVEQLQEDKDKTNVKVKPGTNTEKKLICERENVQKTLASERICLPDEFSVKAAEQDALVQGETNTELETPEGKKLTRVDISRVIKESRSDASDTEESDKEKEYFDDSTEERFCNQSSGSEDSDSSDDFFIGKEKERLKKAKDSKFVTVQEASMEEGNPSAKAMKLESVFCSSLSNSKQKSQNIKRDGSLPTFAKYEPRKQQLVKGAGIKHESKKEQLEQPLHPSWEASKRRREQVSQITAFQGKRIKFDD